jgi:hypothetical protein
MKLLKIFFHSEVNSFIYKLKTEDRLIKNQEIIQRDWNIIVKEPYDSQLLIFKRYNTKANDDHTI